MNTDTLQALRLLAVELVEHPEDGEAMQVYGQLPLQLADAIDDWLPEEDR